MKYLKLLGKHFLYKYRPYASRQRNGKTVCPNCIHHRFRKNLRIMRPKHDAGPPTRLHPRPKEPPHKPNKQTCQRHSSNHYHGCMRFWQVKANLRDELSDRSMPHPLHRHRRRSISITTACVILASTCASSSGCAQRDRERDYGIFSIITAWLALQR
jgi:hypothetical protein